MTLRNKLPPEVHIAKGTKGENQGIPLPAELRDRIPAAEWMNDPDHFDKELFIKETSDFLFDYYGIGSVQDRHTLSMLANQMERYINAVKGEAEYPMVISINNDKTLAPNPYYAISNECMKNIIRLMNELGLTPRSRLGNLAPKANTPVLTILRGPKGKEKE